MQRLRSEDQINKLIGLVKKNPELYGKVSPGIRNVREKIWKDIAKKLRANEGDCKTAWRSLRDQFQKARKESTAKARKHKYYDKLLFLENVVAPVSNSNQRKAPKKRTPDPVFEPSELLMLQEQQSIVYETSTETVKVENEEDSEAFLINVYEDGPINGIPAIEEPDVPDDLVFPQAEEAAMVDEREQFLDNQIVNHNNNNVSNENQIHQGSLLRKDGQQMTPTSGNAYSSGNHTENLNISSSIRDSRGIYKFFESLATSVESCNFSTPELMDLQSKIYNFSSEEIRKTLAKRLKN